MQFFSVLGLLDVNVICQFSFLFAGVYWTFMAD